LIISHWDFDNIEKILEKELLSLGKEVDILNNKKMSFAITNVEVVEDIDTSQFATARIEAFSTGKTRHDTTCDLEALKRTASSIYEKPIIFEYDPTLRDFKSHSPSTIIAGFVVPNSAEFVELDDGTGRTSLRVFAKIWKKYCGKFLQVFSETNTNKKSVSVEIEVDDYEETNDGLLNLLNWRYFAICVLGQFVTEASPGANIEMESFAKKENLAYNIAFSKEFSTPYQDVDFSIPDFVKDSSQKMLEQYHNGEKNINSVQLSLARFLSKNEEITPEKVHQLSKFFAKQSNSNSEFFGGKKGFEWNKLLLDSIDKIDSMASYFDIDRDTIEKDKMSKEKEMNNMAKTKEELAEEVKSKEELEIAEEAEKKAFAMAEEAKVKEELAMAEEAKAKEELAMAEEAKAKEEEEKAKKAKEEEDNKFSLSAYFDVPMALSYLQAEEGDEEEVTGKLKMAAEEIEKGELAGAPAIMSGMFASMQRMSAKYKNMCDKMAELEKFKADIEEQQKMAEVELALSEMAVKVVIPDEAMEEMRENAKSFSLDELEAWKNQCKAKSFDFAVREGGKPTHLKIGLPFHGIKTQPKNVRWAGAKK